MLAQALHAADSDRPDQVVGWPVVAGILAAEVRRLQALQDATPGTEREWMIKFSTPGWNHRRYTGVMTEDIALQVLPLYREQDSNAKLLHRDVTEWEECKGDHWELKG